MGEQSMCLTMEAASFDQVDDGLLEILFDIVTRRAKNDP